MPPQPSGSLAAFKGESAAGFVAALGPEILQVLCILSKDSYSPKEVEFQFSKCPFSSFSLILKKFRVHLCAFCQKMMVGYW